MRQPAPSRLDAQAGLTLIELMIAVVILGIAISAAFSLGYTMINGYRDSRRAVQVERAARGSLSYLSTAIRAASPGVPTGAVVDAVGCNAFPGIQVVNNPDAPDELLLMYGAGRVVTSIRTAFDETSTSLIVVEGAEFQEGDFALVVEPGTRGHLVAIETVADNGDGTWTLALPAAVTTTCPAVAAFSYAPTSLVVKARLAHFYVDASGVVPVMMMDPDGAAGPLEPEPVAEGIEDLQISVAVDDSPTDEVLTEVGLGVDDDEWHYNVDGDADPSAVTVGNWRALRITVMARSTEETSNVTDSIRPAAEDRVAAATGDSFRRRSLSTTVEVRNLRGSP